MITCPISRFSITKWIHLNNGDDGLKHFFSRVYQVLNVGGTFVLEAQPWESYSKAKRMNKVWIQSPEPPSASLHDANRS